MSFYHLSSYIPHFILLHLNLFRDESKGNSSEDGLNWDLTIKAPGLHPINQYPQCPPIDVDSVDQPPSESTNGSDQDIDDGHVILRPHTNNSEGDSPSNGMHNKVPIKSPSSNGEMSRLSNIKQTFFGDDLISGPSSPNNPTPTVSRLVKSLQHRALSIKVINMDFLCFLQIDKQTDSNHEVKLSPDAKKPISPLQNNEKQSTPPKAVPHPDGAPGRHSPPRAPKNSRPSSLIQSDDNVNEVASTAPGLANGGAVPRSASYQRPTPAIKYIINDVSIQIYIRQNSVFSRIILTMLYVIPFSSLIDGEKIPPQQCRCQIEHALRIET